MKTKMKIEINSNDVRVRKGTSEKVRSVKRHDDRRHKNRAAEKRAWRDFIKSEFA